MTPDLPPIGSAAATQTAAASKPFDGASLSTTLQLDSLPSAAVHSSVILAACLTLACLLRHLVISICRLPAAEPGAAMDSMPSVATAVTMIFFMNGTPLLS